MSDIAFCITTMERPAALEAMLLSIAEHQPDAPVYIADQSRDVDAASYDALASRLLESGLRRRPELHRLPFDCGLSAARNHLVESTPEKYKLILDDDFRFTRRTDAAALARLLEAVPEAGAVGGGVGRDGRIPHRGTMLVREGKTLRQLPARGPEEEQHDLRFMRVDCVPNFVLFRAEVFERIRWDPALKIAGEHIDFFLRFQETPFKVLYSPETTVDHQPRQLQPDYRRLRWRGDFIRQVLIKHDLDRLERVSGKVVELRPDGSLTIHKGTG